MGDPLRPLYLRVALNDRDCCFVSLPPNTAAPVISASRISLFRAARAGDTNQDHASDSTIPPPFPVGRPRAPFLVRPRLGRLPRA